MVATHPHPRRPSAVGSVGKPKRKSSLRRTTEKVTPTVSTSATRHAANQRRSKSVSAAVPAEQQPQKQQQQQQQQNRRPSAPAVVMDQTPRLSIADRFMVSDYSNTSTPTVRQAPALPAPFLSTEISNSTLSDSQTAGHSSRPSVADRFMTTPSSHDVGSSANSIRSIQQYRERAGSSFSARTLNSLKPAYSAAAADPMPGRLTIASAFMKSSSTLVPSTPDTARSRAASFADELDMGMGARKPSHVHPLEAHRSGSTLFDDNTTALLNLDLSLAPPSASSSVLDILGPNAKNLRNSRPWGSQDTLVYPHMQQQKRPIYAQFTESEKTTATDNRSFSLGDYFIDSTVADDKHTIAINDTYSTQHGDYDNYDDVEISDCNNKYHQNERQWDYNDDQDEEEHDCDDEEKASYTTRNMSVAGSTAKLNGKKKSNHDHDHDNDNEHQSRGFWIGCCFVSCGQKPSRRTMEQTQKQKREKEIEQQESPPKSRKCGRRGWVFFTFISLIVAVLVTYFLWPRTPLMRIEGASLTSPAKITETKQGVMVGNVAFESEWLVNITVDNRQNHVPTRLSQIQVLAKDALTGLIIGKGMHNDDPNPEHIVLPPNAISTIQLPIRVDYQARDSTDTTFVDLSKACSPQHMVPFNAPDNTVSSNTTQREALPLHFWITLHFFGFDWLGYKPTVIATPATGGFACPQS